MILVTGGTGFTGSYLLYYLLRHNESVRALRRENSNFKETEFIFRTLNEIENIKENGSWQDAFNRIEWVTGNMLDLPSLEDAFDGVTQVYHAAAQVSFVAGNRNNVLQTNIEGTANLVNISIERNIEKFGYVSSIAALSRAEGKFTDEKKSVEAGEGFSSVYSESKYRAELEVWRGVAEGLNAVIVNPGIILGWGAFSKGSAKIFKTVYEGLRFYTGGANAFVDVRDVAQALIQLMQNEEISGERFILTSENITYKDLFDKIAACLGIKGPQIKAGKFLGYSAWIAAYLQSLLSGKEPFITRELVNTGSKSFFYSNEKIKKTLGYEFIPLDKTISDTCKILKKEGLNN